MKKFFLLIFCLFFVASVSAEDIGLRDYKELNIQKGVFLKAINQREISSAVYEVGDAVSLLSTGDTYLGDVKIIPDNSLLLGVVEDVKMPVDGINGSMKIKINKVITPDKKQFNINAYLSNGDGNWIGGELTPPVIYNKLPHFIGANRGFEVIQYVPSTARYYGQHCVLPAGREVLVIIDSTTNYFK